MEAMNDFLHPSSKIISNLEQLSRICKYNKNNGCKIVLTSGCFDLLHGGHLEYVCDAASFGFLVVGINSDNFVKKLKSENRPIRDQNDRAFSMAGFYPVKLVTIFDCDYDLIRAVCPDVYVASKTSHLKVEQDKARMKILKEINAQIVEMGMKSQDSTTEIIKRISCK